MPVRAGRRDSVHPYLRWGIQQSLPCAAKLRPSSGEGTGR